MKRISYFWIFCFSLTILLSCHKKNQEEKLRIACIGDSITYGAYIWNRGKYSYPARLNQSLGDNWDVENFGVNGATLLKKGDKTYWDQREFHAAIEFKPHVVLIMLGTNDTKAHNWLHKREFVLDYKDLISCFAELTPAPIIYICYPIPIYSSDETGLESEMLPMIDKIASESDVRLIDLYSVLNGKEDHYRDGVHPNKKGTALIAGKI
ncbi:xylanase, partial [candidate division KSB1 bacterium]|nr:xylanase [candidate division KSB1 bacterium]